MEKTKLEYSAPQVEALELKTEDVFCASVINSLEGITEETWY